MRAFLLVIALSCSCWLLAQELPIIPAPSEYEIPEGYTFVIDSTTRIIVDNKELRPLADDLRSSILLSTGVDLFQASKKSKKTIELIIDPLISESESAYWINIQPQHILLVGVTKAAVYYALQSLYQLMPPDAMSSAHPNRLTIALPTMAITDEPAYDPRTLVFDRIDSRKLHALIPIAAFYKINRIVIGAQHTIAPSDLDQLKKYAIQYYIILTVANNDAATPSPTAITLGDDVITLTDTATIVSTKLLHAAEALWTPQHLQSQHTDTQPLERHINYFKHRNITIVPTP